jgi:hypothetical protein
LQGVPSGQKNYWSQGKNLIPGMQHEKNHYEIFTEPKLGAQKPP